jgi:microcystin-dependent protein
MADNFLKISKGINLKPQTTAPNNPAEGDIYFDGQDDAFKRYENGAWRLFGEGEGGGSGGTGENFLSNGNAERSESPWELVQNTTPGATPTPNATAAPNINVTITRSSSSPLNGGHSWLLTKDAADRQGHTLRAEVEIPKGYRSNRKFLKYLGQRIDIPESAVKLFVSAWDADAEEWKAPFEPKNAVSGLKHVAPLDALDSDTTKALVQFHIATTDATAGSVKLDDVQFTPDGFVQINEKGIVGEILPYGGDEIPEHFLECNGAALSRTEYADLFAVIGTSFGVGDGSTTFNLPDLQNEFIRGASGTRSVGFSETDTIKAHNHRIRYGTGSGSVRRVQAPATWSGSNADSDDTVTSGVVTGDTFGTETRPRNVAVKFIIRYGNPDSPMISTTEMVNQVGGVNLSGAPDSHDSTGNWVTVKNWPNVSGLKALAYNNATGVFTVQEPCRLKIAFQAVFAANATGSRSARLRINGSSVLFSDSIAGSNPQRGAPQLNFTTGDLKTGDTIDIQTFQDSGGTLAYSTANSGLGTYLSIAQDLSLSVFGAYFDGKWHTMPEVKADYVQRVPNYSTDSHVPIVASGSNSDGEWVRYADGTQVCFSNELTYVQSSAATMSAAWTSPAPFFAGSVPVASQRFSVLSTDYIGNDNRGNFIPVGLRDVSPLSGTRLDQRIYRIGTSFGASDEVKGAYSVVIGRWRAIP